MPVPLSSLEQQVVFGLRPSEYRFVIQDAKERDKLMSDMKRELKRLQVRFLAHWNYDLYTADGKLGRQSCLLR